MRQTIYVKDEGVWSDVKQKSAVMGLSISEYLLGSKHVFDVSQLDRIEEKLDLLLGDRLPEEKGERLDIEIKPGPVIRSDAEVIAEAQKKLESIQASRPYFNPQPKKGVNGRGK